MKFTPSLFLVTLGLFTLNRSYGEEVDNEASVDWHVKEGNEAFAREHFFKAVDHFSVAIDMEPDNKSHYLKRATAQMSLGKAGHAIQDLDNVIRLDPNYSEGYMNRAKCYKLNGDFEGALKDYQQVLKIDSSNKDAMIQVGVVSRARDSANAARKMVEEGNCELARSQLNSVIETSPKNADFRLLRARCNMDLGHYAEIVDDCGRILKDRSDNLEALVLRGQAYYYLGDDEVALNHFKTGLKSDPEHKECKKNHKKVKNVAKYLREGEEFVKTGKVRQAVEVADKGLELEPSDHFHSPKFHILKCRAYNRMKDGSNAHKSCNEAIKLDEESAEAHMFRGEAKILLEEFEGAVKDYEKAKELADDSIMGKVNEGLKNANHQLKLSKRKDYYKWLGVSRQATAQEIKKAYRQLAMRWHPDKVSADEAELGQKKIQQINEAYGVLSDPDLKRRYDLGEEIDGESPDGHAQGQQQGHPFRQGGFPGGFNFHFG